VYSASPSAGRGLCEIDHATSGVRASVVPPGVIMASLRLAKSLPGRRRQASCATQLAVKAMLINALYQFHSNSEIDIEVKREINHTTTQRR
jgi:hypothetical protein